MADITANGPAAYAGFATGDIILSVNGQIIGKKRELLLALAALPVGQRAEVRVWRQRAEIVLHPLIGEMPGIPEIIAEAPSEFRTPRRDLVIGLNLAPLTEGRRELLGIPAHIRGAIVLSVDDASVILGTGVRPGDVIESINEIPVASPEETIRRLKQAFGGGGRNVLMLINRQGTNRYVAMFLEGKPNGGDDT